MSNRHWGCPTHGNYASTIPRCNDCVEPISEVTLSGTDEGILVTWPNGDTYSFYGLHWALSAVLRGIRDHERRIEP